ncbi:MAG: transposase [Sulfurovum sp.]|nr:transposase [Sulfurovum sp.]
MYKNLPHISNYGYYQFLTFRTKDSLDEYLKRVMNLPIENHNKQYQIDKYLDSSSHGRYLNNSILALSKEYIRKQDKKLFELICFSIMPNHIHILFKETMPLSEAIRKLKGGLAF